MTSQEPERAGGKVVVFLLLGLVLLFGGAYTAAFFAAGDNVPRGTTIAGVDVGGRSQDEAVRALEQGLAGRVSEPIQVTVDGDATSVSPEQAGLSVDALASVEAAGGERSWAPDRIWDYFTGGDDLDPVVDVDDASMDETIEDLAETVGTAPRDGDIRFEGSRVRVVEPRTGEAIDPEDGRAALVDAYLQQDEPAVLTLASSEPDIDESDVQEGLDSFANPALSGPVTLVFDQTPVRLQPRDFGAALGMKADDGELVPDLDEKELIRLVDDAVSTDGAPVDATVRLVNDEPKVIPAKPGVSYRPEDVSETFLDLVLQPAGAREHQVKASVAKADFTTRDARRLRITEQVSEFTTYFPHAEYRNINIGRAAELVSGTVLKPGDTFSLNGIVGERTRANGFTEGFVIDDGIFKEDLGGGVSQMATTTFNAMFFAGLEDIDHKPHSFYIDRYPVGREATVAWGSVDLRFRNDTPYGVLVNAEVTPSTPSSQGVVTVRMFSTKYWNITSKTSDRYNFTQEQTRILHTADCYPNDGYGGFDVDVTRIFRRAGERKVDHREPFHTTYHPLRHGHLPPAALIESLEPSNPRRLPLVVPACAASSLRPCPSSRRWRCASRSARLPPPPLRSNRCRTRPSARRRTARTTGTVAPPGSGPRRWSSSTARSATRSRCSTSCPGPWSMRASASTPSTTATGPPARSSSPRAS